MRSAGIVIYGYQMETASVIYIFISLLIAVVNEQSTAEVIERLALGYQIV